MPLEMNPRPKSGQGAPSASESRSPVFQAPDPGVKASKSPYFTEREDQQFPFRQMLDLQSGVLIVLSHFIHLLGPLPEF